MAKEKRYVIKAMQYRGRKFPVINFLALWLLCDRLKIPEWGWGVYWTAVGFVVMVLIFDLIKYEQEEVDIQDMLKENIIRQEGSKCEKNQSYEELKEVIRERYRKERAK